MPNALMIGVDYDLFWTLNPKSLTPFIKAFRLRREYEDSISWTNGLYIRMAVASVLTKSAKYPDKPYGLEKSPEQKAAEIKQKFIEKAAEINARLRKEKS